MSETITTNSSHAAPAPHAFLDQIKSPLRRAKEKKEVEAITEQRTCMGLEAAINSMPGGIPGINGKLRVKLSVSDEGYQAYVIVEPDIILPDTSILAA